MKTTHLIPLLLAIALLPCCTVYRPPSGAYFSQVGGQVHIVAEDFELVANNEASFKDATRAVTTLGLANIAAGVLKSQDASKAATDQKAIAADTEKAKIGAGVEKAALDQEVKLKALELEMME